MASEPAPPERLSLVADVCRALDVPHLTLRETTLLMVVERREKERLARLDAVLESIQNAQSTGAARPWVMELREALR